MKKPHHPLILAMKRLLKARGWTYARLAPELDLSEASVKRLFSGERFTLQRLEQICTLLDIELGDLVREADFGRATVHRLTETQERELAADLRLLLVAVCALNHWPLSRIIRDYQMEEPECIGHLARLDRLGLIDLLPGNRVKLRVARDFSWLPGGPIHRFFREHAQDDFLQAPFDGLGEALHVASGMLTQDAQVRLQQKLRRLVQEAAELHQECLDAPSEARHGTVMLLAQRSWEPAVFTRMRRVK